MKMFKKVLLIVILLFGLLTAGIYLFIPSGISVSADKLVRANASAAFRRTSDPAAWAIWWPFPKGGYRVGNALYPNVSVGMELDGDSLSGVLTVLTVGTNDSTELLFRGRLDAGVTPWGRFAAYRRSLRVEERLRAVLAAAAVYLGKTEHLYGMPVKQVMSHDSTILVTQIKTAGYPSTFEIYAAISGLRAYIASQGATAVNYPMLHVRADSGRFVSMIALPVDRELKGTKAYIPERFVPWKVLVGEVRGGAATAEEGLRQLHVYITDHQLTEMAMAFQLLVTERDKEADTSRWVTQVITPVP